MFVFINFGDPLISRTPAELVLLLEDDTPLLLEDGTYLILETENE